MKAPSQRRRFFYTFISLTNFQMKNQPFIVPLVGLMLGILFAEFIPNPFANGLKLLGAVLIFISLIYLALKRYDFFWVLTIFMVFGWIYSNYYNAHQSIPAENLDKNLPLKIEIEESYKSSEKFRKYKAKIVQIDKIPTSNHVLLYWRKENAELYPQDEVWLHAKIIPTQKPMNPHQFDYAKWLKRQKIHYTLFSDTIYQKTKSGNSIAFKTSHYKRETHRKLMKIGYTKSSADLIGAMLLGDRTEMDPQTEENYRKTGVVHILSISGLHVMMVYSIFMMILYPLVYLKNGKILRILFSLVLIWSFVVFVGFQPPVLRSAVMISVFYITLTFKRKPNVYHTLAISALILLLINPNFLFDVGFQLSFSAVFFIVYLHPIYQKLFRPKSKLSKIAIAFIGTSISAQIGTMPFTLFYFHQTSGLFLAGNVVMIIASYFMMAGGMLALILLELDLNFQIWIDIFNRIIEGCNTYIQWLSSFDLLIFDNISFTVFESILVLIVLILIGIIGKKPDFKWIMILFAVVFIFQLQNLIRQQKLSRKKEIIVFHQPRNSVIGIRNGLKLDIYAQDLSDSVKLKQYLIRPYVLNEGIKTLRIKELNEVSRENYYKSGNSVYFENLHLVYVSENIPTKPFPADYLLVQNNIEIDLKNLHPETKIILDGSNYPNHLKDSEIPIWRTRENGALVISIMPDSPKAGF